jgi:hypothetical protein
MHLMFTGLQIDKIVITSRAKTEIDISTLPQLCAALINPFIEPVHQSEHISIVFLDDIDGSEMISEKSERSESDITIGRAGCDRR